MEQASNMSLVEALAVCDTVTPAPATAHEALKRLSHELARALCLPHTALKSYAKEREAANIENMLPDTEFVVVREDGDKRMELAKIPEGIGAVEIGLLSHLVGVYERSPFSLNSLAGLLPATDVPALRHALVNLQASGYVRYLEDSNALLVRSTH